jgi:hypothetical protein
MLEEISSSWYRNALGSRAMPPDPRDAFLLWCIEGASFLEVIGAKKVSFHVLIDLASEHETASFL